MQWYVRSAGHADAHYGWLDSDGTTTARCGLRFRPQPEMFGEGPAVLQPPIDRQRCCPQCQATGIELEADAVAVAGLIESL